MNIKKFRKEFDGFVKIYMAWTTNKKQGDQDE